jgi:hypothetical protein
MTQTLQNQYNLIKEGKGNKQQFLKQAKHLFPQYLNQYSDFDTSIKVLKSKQIISEGIGGVVSKGFNIWDWKKILNEEAKAEEKTTSKEVENANKNAYDNKDTKNADNINFNEIMKGFYAELRDEKNNGKTGDELKAIVVKNLAKDPLYYTKNGEFGVKGLGYTTEAPGLGTPKEPTGKYKSSGYGDINKDVKSVKSNVKDSLSDSEAKTTMPKKVKEMSVTPQNSKGVKKMDMPGKEKRIKLKESVDEVVYQGISVGNVTGKGGEQKAPRVLYLAKSAIEKINKDEKNIKIISKGDKQMYMYVSSFFKNALDELERGRTSHEKENKKSPLARLISDILPSIVRGKIKKEINPKMDNGLKMHYVNIILSPKKDGDGYWIQLKKEFQPLTTETNINENQDIYKQLADLEYDLIMADDAERKSEIEAKIKELESGLSEHKFRSIIYSIIKEELNKESVKINGKIVRTYTQNGDKSYNVIYDDGTKDIIMVSNDSWDDINVLNTNTTKK